MDLLCHCWLICRLYLDSFIDWLVYEMTAKYPFVLNVKVKQTETLYTMHESRNKRDGGCREQVDENERRRAPLWEVKGEGACSRGWDESMEKKKGLGCEEEKMGSSGWRWERGRERLRLYQRKGCHQSQGDLGNGKGAAGAQGGDTRCELMEELDNLLFFFFLLSPHLFLLLFFLCFHLSICLFFIPVSPQSHCSLLMPACS